MIKGKEVSLRAVEMADRNFLFEWLNDLEAVQYIGLYYPITMNGIEEAIKGLDHKENAIFFMIQTKKSDTRTNQTIGYCELYNIDWLNRYAEIKVLIGKEYQNAGYGFYATEVLLNYGFKTVNLNKIAVYIHEKNIRGIEILENLKFTKEGSLCKKLFTNGYYHDEFVYGLLREHWKGL